MEPEAKKIKPEKIVKIVSWFLILGGISALLLVPALIFTLGLSEARKPLSIISYMFNIDRTLAILIHYLINIIGSVVIGFGLRSYKNWARISLLFWVFVSFSLLPRKLASISGESSLFSMFVGVGLDILILYLFYFSVDIAKLFQGVNAISSRYKNMAAGFIFVMILFSILSISPVFGYLRPPKNPNVQNCLQSDNPFSVLFLGVDPELCYEQAIENVSKVMDCDLIPDYFKRAIYIADRCHLIIAHRLKNANFCDGSSSVRETYACKNSVAVNARDPNACYSFSDQTSRDQCFSSLAEIKRDASLCEEVSLSSQSSCQVDVGFAEAKIYSCDRVLPLLNINEQPKFKMKCYMHVADRGGGVSICHNLALEFGARNALYCYHESLRYLSNDLPICEQVPLKNDGNPESRYQCYTGLAMRFDEKYCDLIPNDHTDYQQCFRRVRLKNKAFSGIPIDSNLDWRTPAGVRPLN